MKQEKLFKAWQTKMRIFTLFFLLFILVSSCYRNSFFLSTIDNEKTIIAVLPFYGNGVSPVITQLATNELLRLIFITHKIAVSEPLEINYYLRKMNLNDSYAISSAQWGELADSLGATHLVIGLIESSFTPEPEEKSLQRVTVTLRFIDCENRRIVGMISKKTLTSESLEHVIPFMLENMLKIK